MNVILYYKNTFLKAGEMLHSLMADPDDFSALLDLQVLLISQIKRCEKNIIRLKSISQQLKISLRH
jgi:hypothetical protein